MVEDLKKTIQDREIPDGFIKTTEQPLTSLTSEQKVILNRKGNVLFNNGDYDAAERIFIATGYSDGLTRIGDIYAEKKQSLKALKLYQLAHNKKKSAPLIEKLAGLISVLIQEDKK
ncbi:MAG: hypothetical protein K6F69_03730 [Treponema sp.]|nr:hypothetical protein [Treponema sp.]